MTSKERKRRAIRKAVATRAANLASRKQYLEVDRPARRRLDNLLNHFLRANSVSVRFTPRNSGFRLKGGVVYGTLLSVDGMSVIVLPEGYKRAHEYHYGFWEPLLL